MVVAETSPRKTYDVCIVGAGASGLMCAIQAAARGLDVLVLEKGAKAGLKILVSGGGRCNFTNMYADPTEHYLSQNSNFCISAMRRFDAWQFIAMVDAAGIAYHEKKLGQLFCDNSAQDILTMLLRECDQVGVEIKLRQEVLEVIPLGDTDTQAPKNAPRFTLTTAEHRFYANKVVLASGGLSLPKISSDLSIRTAKRMGLGVVPTHAALVPFTWTAEDKLIYADLSGIAVDATVSCGHTSFRENILFTHRGLSGPAILQISSYWRRARRSK